MKRFTSLLIACCLLVPSAWASDVEGYRKTLLSALSLFDPDPAVDQALKDMDVGFIDYLMDQAKAGHSENVVLCALVVQKYMQFRSEIPEEKRERIVEFLTTQPSDKTSNTIVSRLEYLSQINHFKVRDFARQFITNPEPSVQFYVRKITSNISDEPRTTNDSRNQIQKNKFPQPSQASIVVEPAESNSVAPVWQWLAAIVCALGIAVAMLVKGYSNRYKL
jgi:hypothetical protein